MLFQAPSAPAAEGGGEEEEEGGKQKGFLASIPNPCTFLWGGPTQPTTDDNLWYVVCVYNAIVIMRISRSTKYYCDYVVV
jgi:hypothetical protein